MEEGLADPLSLAKDACLIKDAQSEYGKLDILICGSCHAVFHFVDEYNAHKSNKCSESVLSQQCENDDKALTWAFCLWKNREMKDKSMGMWQMYQKWCKLPQEDKDLWIAGGQTILSLNKIRVAKMQEVKFKVKREEEKDPLALTDSDTNALDDKDSKSSLSKPLHKSPKSSDPPSSGNETPKDELKEYVVESIVGKRFNSKRKNWEYKVKWENFDDSQCSWEPMEHLGGCKALINVFEQKIKMDKEKKKLGEPPKLTKVKTEVKTDDESVDFGIGRRPQRSSKQKALNQVKRWLGEGGSDNEDSKDSRKRLHLDDDSDDMSFEKRMKLEEDSDDSLDEDDDEKPKKSSLLKHNTSNGLAGKKLPNNVLIPDAQGIVRINQKQLPSLSSGVYIMSKTAGIIKLDSQTSKIAASGGQAVVKVAPRIGQTHIRIVKKDGATASRVIQMGQKSKMSPSASGRSLVSHKVSKFVRNPNSRLTKIDPKVELENKKEPEDSKESAADDEDSDCGLPELEFPSEIIPPEPEEPPGEFTLDPTTGKIAGIEYPENEPEISTATEENKENSESTLDNIVKLAAADITEADLKPDLAENIAEGNTDLGTQQPIVEEKKQEIHRFEPMRVKKEAPHMSKVQQKFMISPSIRSSNILERTLQNPRTVFKSSPQGYSRQIYAKSPQRIINSAMTPKLTSPLVRTVVRSSYSSKPKSVFPKQRVYMSSPGNKMSESLIKQQQYHAKPNPTKRVGNIGGTTIYKRSMQQQPKMTPSPKVFQRTNVVRKPVPTVRTVVQKSPKPVINMPSLMDDDLPVQPIADNMQMMQKLDTPVQEAAPETIAAAAAASSTSSSDEIASFAALADGEAPIFITGDDGTVYQVAGQNEQGQTILITQGPDGQQQCLLVTSETAGPDDAQEAQEEGNAQQVAAMMEGGELGAEKTDNNMEENNGVGEAEVGVQEPLTIKTEPETQSEVVAQFVKAVPPSPGGTPKVMVMLPDGNLVVTPVTAEEYASWQELEK